MVGDSHSNASFTCPICLGEKQVTYDHGRTEESNPAAPRTVDQSGNPIFELNACSHKFCVACLHAYVQSKLLDGEVNVPCCHFKMSPSEDDFRPCNVLIQESDIRQLVYMNHAAGQTSIDASCCNDEGTSSRVPNSTNERVFFDGDELWNKYQKLKFDAKHGKSTVRRCPKCDEAQLFDEECMKEYQAKYLTQRSNCATPNDSRNGSVQSVGRLGRAFDVFRRRQRDAEPMPCASNGKNIRSAAGKEGGNGQGEEISSMHIGMESEDVVVADEGGCLEVESNPKQHDKQEEVTEANLRHNGLSVANFPPEGEILAELHQRLPDASNSVLGETLMGKDLMSDNPCELASDTTIAVASERHDVSIAQASSMDEGGKACESRGGTASPPRAHGAVVDSGESSSLVKSKIPNVLCQSCGLEFCYFHSNAHSGKSCVEYHKKSIELERSNMEYANQILRAKPCPNCGIAVSKDGGCNQIKCGSCGTYFCWLCGEIVDDGAFPQHFRWWNLGGCPNMQLDENNEPLRCMVWGARLLSVLQIIVLGIPALMISIVSMILCPCLVPGCGNTNRERLVNSLSFWGSFLSSLLLLPFTCLGMLLVSAVVCFVAAVAFFFKILTPQSGNTATPNNLEDHVGGGNRASAGNSSESVSGDARSADDFRRELENIFDRMEDGRSTSGSH